MRPLQILALLLALLLLLSACAVKPDGPAQTTAAPESAAPAQTEPSRPAQTEPSEQASEPLPVERPDVEIPALGQIEQAESYASVVRRLSQDVSRIAALWNPEGLSFETDEPGGEDPGMEDVGVRRVVPGVEEADSFRTDGRYLYVLDSFGLTVASAEGADSRVLSYTEVRQDPLSGGSGWMEGLYVWEDRAAVVYSRSDYGTDENGAWYDVTETHAAIFDLSDRTAPVLLADTAVDGSYRDSRMTGGTLYLLTTHNPVQPASEADPERCIPGVREDGAYRLLKPEEIWLCPDSGSFSFTSAAAIRMEDGAILSALAFTDVTDAVYLDATGLYLARSVRCAAESEPYSEAPYRVTDRLTALRTEVKRLALQADGSLALSGSAVVPGGIASATSMDVLDGKLRLATEAEERSYSVYTDERHGWTNYAPGETVRSAAVTVLDGDLRTLGRAEDLLPGSRLLACRFLGRSAWLIPAAETEPVRVVDLSDPASPAPAGELEFPGPTTSVQLCGALVVGFGGAPDESGLQLSLYDVSDPGRVLLRQRKALTQYPYSLALGDRKALLIDPETGLIGFPTDPGEAENYALFAFDDAGFERIGGAALAYMTEDCRAVFANGCVYVCSGGVIYVLDAETAELLAGVTSAEG